MSLITVIIPVYNMASFLPEAVQSVLVNDYPEIELVIVDDGSEDDTLQIAESLGQLAKAKSHISIEIISVPHTGKSAALNKGLKIANGDFITFLDADDKLTQNSLSLRMRKLKATKADIALGEFVVVSNCEITGRRSISSENNTKLLNQFFYGWKTPFHLNGMLIKKEIIKQAGPFDERLYRSQEIDYSIRLLKLDPDIAFIHQPVYHYNKHRTVKERLRVRMNSFKIVLKMWAKHAKGRRKALLLTWKTALEVMKFGYEIFGSYKK